MAVAVAHLALSVAVAAEADLDLFHIHHLLRRFPISEQALLPDCIERPLAGERKMAEDEFGHTR